MRFGCGRTRAIVAMASLLAAPAVAAVDPGQSLYFEPNQGQAPPALRYVARVRGAPLGVTDAGLVLGVGDTAVRLVWDGAAGTPEATDPLVGHSNYLRGADPARWHGGVPHFARVRQRAAWPGIDLELREGGGELEYDFRLAPGADPARIALRVEGAERVEIGDDGALRIHAGGAVLVQHAPLVFQEVEGARREIASRYVRRGADRFGVSVAAFDAARPLVVDPVVAYATALGGPGADKAFDIAVDAQGYAYVAGETESATGLATTPGGVQPNLAGGTDAFVAKLSPTGTLLYATYLGGTGDDSAWSIAVGGSGAIYVSGRTASTDFPTVSPLQPANAGGADAFVAKLAPDGASLVYSTYYGGSGDETAEAVALGPAEKAVVHGITSSSDLAVPNAQVPFFRGARDAFVAQLAPDGQSLEWATYFGGTGSENPDQTGVGLAVTAQNEVVICGTTESADIPIAYALQPTFAGGTRDGYVAKFTPAGAIVFSTYIGRGGGDTLRALTVDETGAIYLGGASRSFDFPLVNPIQRTKSVHYDAVILKLDPTAHRILFSTYLGGDGTDAVRSIAVDAHHNVYVHGQTLSSDFPEIAPLPGQHAGAIDDFVAKLGPSGSTLLYASRIGGSSDETPFPDDLGIAVDPNGQVVLAGSTVSQNFPWVAAQDATVEAVEGFAVRLSGTPEIDLSLAGTPAAATWSVRLRNAGAVTADGQVKVYSRATPAAAPVALDLGVSPLGSVASGASVALATDRPLPGGFTSGQVVTARWLDRVTGRVLAEAVCEGLPCP